MIVTTSSLEPGLWARVDAAAQRLADEMRQREAAGAILFGKPIEPGPPPCSCACAACTAATGETGGH